MVMRIIQTASGGALPFLEVSAARHTAYAAAHGAALVLERRGFGNALPQWDKVDLIIRELDNAANGDFVCYLDANAWIAKPTTDLASMIAPGDDIAAYGAQTSPGFTWFNGGLIGQIASDKMRLFWRAFKAEPRFPGFPLDDYNLSRYLVKRTDIKCTILGTDWHDWPGVASRGTMPKITAETYAAWQPKGVIGAVHGIPKDIALDMMKSRCI